VRQLVLVEALAAERDEQYGPDVGMGAEPLHHGFGIGVRIAPGKADDMDVAVAERHGDLARDVVGAFDEVGHDDSVADALAAIGAEISLHHHGVVSP
jgi:hypothetical protein